VTFGDHDQHDAFDTAPADPEQVARKLHELRRRDGFESVGWDDLSESHRARLVLVVVALIAWWRRSGLT
jgi:hypothetical protein